MKETARWPLAFVSGAAVVLLTVLQIALGAEPRATRGSIEGRPDALIDLDSADGLVLAGAAWQTRPVVPAAATFRAAAADMTATGAEVATLDIGAKPGSPAFESGDWTPVPAGGLKQRRGPGRASFAWYRTAVTLPAMVGGVAVTGTSAILEVVVDDYAEVWVNGQLARGLGQAGGSVVAGFNAANRVVLTRDARPGMRFELAVFAANGPLSDPPANYIWVRSATIDFYRPRPERRAVKLDVDRRDAGLDALLPAGAVLEQLASGFQFTEGPVWVPAERALLFSDPNENTIYRYHEDSGVSVFRVKSGYAGADIGEYHQPGSNGLALDSEGRLTIAEHGNRRISRLEKNGVVTTLADRFEGRRLNSPNDLVYRSDGALYFTDPPFGLPKVYDDRRKELPFSGVFRLKDGQLTLLSTDLKGPNGIAFSPDEQYLYVTNWEEQRKIVMRYDVGPDGRLAGARVFFDMTGATGEEALDGVKVDRDGTLFVSGPGGLWVIAADGTHLGTLKLPELAANLAWGDEDGRGLYLTARSGLYRLRLARGAAAQRTTAR